MLEFNQRPPATVDDVNLSPAGEYALSRRISSPGAMRAFGLAALTEIIDAFGGEPTYGDINTYAHHVGKQAADVIYGSPDPSYNRNDSYAANVGFSDGMGLFGMGGNADRDYVRDLLAAAQKGKAGVAK